MFLPADYLTEMAGKASVHHTNSQWPLGQKPLCAKVHITRKCQKDVTCIRERFWVEAWEASQSRHQRDSQWAKALSDDADISNTGLWLIAIYSCLYSKACLCRKWGRKRIVSWRAWKALWAQSLLFKICEPSPLLTSWATLDKLPDSVPSLNTRCRVEVVLGKETRTRLLCLTFSIYAWQNALQDAGYTYSVFNPFYCLKRPSSTLWKTAFQM